MAEPLLLTYNLEPGTASALCAVCEGLNIRIRTVDRDEYALPIGALAGIPVKTGRQQDAQAGFGEPMLVMCHMLSPQLDAFLQAMRSASIPAIPLKAVLTPFNATWSSPRLRDELIREHWEMQRHSRRD